MPDGKRMTTRLKELFERPELFVLPSGMNPMGAKMAGARSHLSGQLSSSARGEVAIRFNMFHRPAL